MNLKTLKIFSQNVYKNFVLTDIILENNKNFDILFIQEPLSQLSVLFQALYLKKKKLWKLSTIFCGLYLQDCHL